jgi:hypothetical protein
VTASPGPEPTVYELTIAGTIGPVLRGALAPYASATSEVHTVIRADVAQGDLVDLVLMLQARGLEIADIHELP